MAGISRFSVEKKPFLRQIRNSLDFSLVLMYNGAG